MKSGTIKRVLPVLTGLLVLVIAGCASLSTGQLGVKYGETAPRQRVVATLPEGVPDYWSEVKPVLEKRCVSCHACYDAPCQLKLGSIEGIERGASTALVYDASRLRAEPLSRLFEDAQTTAQWRQKGFHPVLNEYTNTPEANREAGVMYRMLQLKADNPLPQQALLADSFDLSLNRKQACTTAEQFDSFARKHPSWGMPYALPGLDADDQSLLLRWLEAGAPYTARPPLDAGIATEVEDWERFLNDGAPKARLMARYIYEHLFLAHLYFPDLDDRQFFKLVRSSTPPGQPVNVIATRRPYDDPGTLRVYYRLQPVVDSIVVKTHMPYALDSDRMNKWQAWFIDADFPVTSLPKYGSEEASNPFRTFRQIPVRSRYRFLLEEAQFTIMSFIKGPVCRGQVALNVINDHFWVFFVDPANPKLDVLEEFISSQAANMELPASTEEIFRPVSHWRKYAAQQKALLAQADAYLADNVSESEELGLQLVWNGDGDNDNAALTVFRHFDSASVEKGLVGEPPKTAWLIGYPLLERIHYLLVAGYDVYGNLGHQLLSRIYMDFLRMEGETAFLMLLPREARNRERDYWYREADSTVSEYMTLPRFEAHLDSDIDFHSDNEKLELYDLLQQHLSAVLPDRHDLSTITDDDARKALQQLNGLVNPAVTLMPQVSFLEIAGSGESLFVTQIRNNAHLNITSLFGEKKFRKPDEDSLSIVPGFISAYPNAFFVVHRDDLDHYVSSIRAMRDESDYASLMSEFGVRRTSPDFWQHSDRFQNALDRWSGVEAGILDLGRYENR